MDRFGSKGVILMEGITGCIRGTALRPTITHAGAAEAEFRLG